MFKVEDFLKLHIYKKNFKTWVFELISRDFKENVLFPCAGPIFVRHNSYQFWLADGYIQ